MSLMDRMMNSNMKRIKKMHKQMLDMQEEIYAEDGERIEKLNKVAAERGAPGAKIQYKAMAEGIKEGLTGESSKKCPACDAEIDVAAKYCSECGAKQ